MNAKNLIKSKYYQGFTLLEVMVALAILAVVAISASQASRSYLLSVQNIKTRTLAHFVAENTLVDLRVNQVWLTSPMTRQVNEQGQQWQVTITPQNTMVDTIKQISIAVAPINQHGVIQNNVVDLEAMLSKPAETQP